jgi:hypothetical protein
VQTIVVAFSDRLNGVTDLTVIYVSRLSNCTRTNMLSAWKAENFLYTLFSVMPNSRYLRSSALGAGACILDIAGISRHRSNNGACSCYESSLLELRSSIPQIFLTNTCRCMELTRQLVLRGTPRSCSMLTVTVLRRVILKAALEQLESKFVRNNRSQTFNRLTQHY